jgi:tetratricopeptide (TPR) repeat protein
LGVPAYWRELGRDTEKDPYLPELPRKVDIVRPWFVGRFNEDSYPGRLLFIPDGCCGENAQKADPVSNRTTLVTMPEKNLAHAARGAASGKRTRWFKAIALLLPFLVLFLLEVGLRIFHYGYDTSLFMEYPRDQRYLVLNPNASRKYFTDPAMAPTGNSEPFLKLKAENTCRIFVLGESTTIGYPYFHNGSFHRWLQYRLTRTYPGRSFELINLSVTAVNSYTVLGFAKELVDYQPDAVLLYSGHNEYYGTLGVASTSRLSGNRTLIRLMLALRRLRLTQLLSNGYRRLMGLFRPVGNYSGETLMQMMVADSHIPFGSAIYQRGLDQFEANMDETLKLFSDRQIPVYISNLISNEKDMKPFVSVEPDNNAASQYALGRLAYERGDTGEARGYFANAIDLDGLRFRAPGAMNGIIARLCATYSDAHLVDAHSEFGDWSAGRLIGNELLLEHVHPNLTGYALLSDAFYRELKETHFFSAGGREVVGGGQNVAGGGRDTAAEGEDTAAEMTLLQLLKDMPLTVLDSLSGAYKIERLKRNWPFKDGSARDSLPVITAAQQLAYAVAFGKMRWQTAMDSLYGQYMATGDLLRARTLMEAMTLEHPQDVFYFEQAANICGKLNDLPQAAFYFQQAFQLDASFERARTLFVLYLGFDRPDEAVRYIDYALRSKPDQRVAMVKRYTEQVIRLERSVSADPRLRASVDSTIASLYMKMGNQAGACVRLEKVLTRDPRSPNALAWLSRLNAKNH